MFRDRGWILDGGLATELERRGQDLDHPLWSARCLIDARDAIVAVHRDYLRAGAEIVTTATYQATRNGLMRAGLSGPDAEACFTDAVALARRAIALEGGTALVAASAGSYGATLADGSEYRGDYGLSVEALVAFHRPRLMRLVGADLIACETVPSLAEARALAHCLSEFDTPSWISFSCGDEAHVNDGEPIEACAAALAEVPSIVGVGINCTPPRFVAPLLRRLRHATDLAVVAYANSGEGYDGRGWTGDGATPEAYAALATQWWEAGADVIGGCCRTTPAHIAAVASLRP